MIVCPVHKYSSFMSQMITLDFDLLQSLFLHHLMVAVQLLIFQIIFNEMRMYFSCVSRILETLWIILLKNIDCSYMKNLNLWSLLQMIHVGSDLFV